LPVSAIFARLWSAQGREGEALDLLAPVLAQVTEGHSALDVRAAHDLHDALAARVQRPLFSNGPV